MTYSFELEQLTPTIGAVVKNIELADTKNLVNLRDPLLDALHKYKVLFFENQQLTPVQHRDVAAVFGDLHTHPIYPATPEAAEIIVLDTHPDNPPDNDNWHTDVSFIKTPPMGALLHAIQVPDVGGDTLWTDCIAAYNSLSEPLKAYLSGLTGEHDIVKSFPYDRYGLTPEALARLDEAVAKHKPVHHPVVRTHPVTGEKGIYVNDGFTTKIKELSDLESKSLLSLLFSVVAKPEFSVRWKWKKNDLAFWDNRLTQHYATVNYLPNRRIMHRATILGDAPF